MPSKVAKSEKKYIFSVIRKISSTKQMKYALVPHYYENMAIYL